MLDRKKLQSMAQEGNQAAAEVADQGDKEAAEIAAVLDADPGALPDLSKFTDEDATKLIKIQAGARGMLDRKKLQAMAAEGNEAAVEAEAALEADPDALPDLSKFSDEDAAKLVKIQAGARGMLDRKRVHTLT